MKNKKVLGVDIGNVIINHRLSDPNDKTLYEERYSTIPPTENVFNALNKLNTYFHNDVHLISKCTEWAEKKITEWLDYNDFYTKTGIDRSHVHFVRERSDKNTLCNKLGITHFIDDRLEVLSHMIEPERTLILFQPDKSEVDIFQKYLNGVTVVDTWDDVLKILII